MKFQGRAQLISLILLILSTFIYCSREDYGTETINETEGSFILTITDGPFPISLVAETNITIDEIEIRNVDPNNGNPFITVSTDTHTVNLINLRNGVTQNLATIKIPVGTYDLIRLYVADATIVLTDSQEFDLTIPSGAQTGIKVFINPPIVVKGGLTSEVLIDFDLSKSFEVQGNPSTPAGIKGFHFKPVIRAVNNTTAGRIIGTVLDTASVALENAQVWIEQDSVISSTFSDVNGFYALIGLTTGIYSAFATKSGYDTVSVPNVEVVAGNQTVQDFTLTLQ